MATYYVGSGGNDGNSGLTWALRKLTLNGAEDVPVAAGDTVYVAPGVYREQLTCDVSGAGGSPITYIGDVTGEHTDGVGGIVRVTGSDNDTSDAGRTACFRVQDYDYRTFRGFWCDFGTYNVQAWSASNDLILEDCVFSYATTVLLNLSNATDWTIRRCLFHSLPLFSYMVSASDGAGIADAAALIENCIFFGTAGNVSVYSSKVGGITTRNCILYGGYRGVQCENTLPGGHTDMVVENCLLVCNQNAVISDNAGEITEDYNAFYGNSTDRTNVAAGGNSNTYPALWLPPILHSGASQVSGFKFPWWFGELSEWSQIQAITGSNEPTEDLRGIVRPTTASKNSWGPCQFWDVERETTTVRSGSVSITFHDAGSHQIWVPVEAVETTFTVYCYREANYAGTNPRMVIKQPGQSDDTTTDTGAASSWNQLTTTLTPAADPPYVIVELQSLNTAAAGNYDSFFDDLKVLR